MKFSRLSLRLGRVTVDESLGAGVTAEALGEAIRLALIDRLQTRHAATAEAALPLPGTTALGSLIANSIAGKIESTGGSNGGP